VYPFWVILMATSQLSDHTDLLQESCRAVKTHSICVNTFNFSD
jgi:hypothetical protein